MSDCSNHKIEQLGAWLIVAAKSHRPQRPKASSPQLYIQRLGRNTLRKLEGGWRGVSASGLWGLLLEGNCITVKRKARTACKHNAAHKAWSPARQLCFACRPFSLGWLSAGAGVEGRSAHLLEAARKDALFCDVHGHQFLLCVGSLTNGCAY